ncbi:shikimate kinase [Bremerella sp. JC817]|uniref:shikimate kinase n=1 Tax=Bremerella sp. JC817 TaxID=3231756 RepID=UPI00345B0FA4
MAMNLALIGYRGTGKSHVARLLAKSLGWPMVDADVHVEQTAGRTIAQIFADQGEAAFRDLESSSLQTLTEHSEHVLSLGGGVILRESNRARIADRCFTVWLTAPPEEIARRLSLDQVTHTQRPSLTGKSPLEEIAEVLAARLPLYQQCADLVIETEGKTPEDVAQSILDQLPSSLTQKEP